MSESKINNSQIADLAKRSLMMEEEMFQTLSQLLQADLADSDISKAEADRIQAVLSTMHADTERHAKFDQELMRRYNQVKDNE